MSAREDVLQRIREAIGSDDPAREELAAAATRARAALETATHPPGTSAGEGARTATVARFVERVSEYQATVHRVTPGQVAATVAAVLAAAGATEILAPRGLPEPWVADVSVRREAAPWTARELDASHAVVTGCALAIAETGTIILDAGPDQGRRALTLVPDHHVCIVAEDRIVATVAEGLTAVTPTAPLTLISGPSATSDIELDRVEGVHGPRRLDVVVVK